MVFSFILLNDTILPADEAKVHVEERAFRFGDGIFETMRVHGGVLYQERSHRERLEAGLNVLRIPADTETIFQRCRELLHRNACREGIVRLSVSRGIGSRGYLPLVPPDAGPTIVGEVTPLPAALPDAPVSLWCTRWRKPSPDVLPVAAKTMQGLNSTLARMEAAEHGCFEALQCNAEGHVAEGSSATLLWRKEETLYTPALSCGIVAGTTRAALLRLSPWPVQEGSYTPGVLEGADAVILANVAWEALPVARLAPQGWTFPESAAVADTLRTLLRQDREKTAV